jgi:MFS family permease
MPPTNPTAGPGTTSHDVVLTTRGRPFRLLWLAQTTGQFGSQVTIIALPLVAILALEAPDFWVAALSAAAFLPYLLVGLHAGVYVDRWNRKRVMVVCDLGRAVLLAAIPVLGAVSLLSIWTLVVIAVLLGSFNVFFEIAYQAYLPQVVDRAWLPDGNSKLEMSNSAARVIGPGAGGTLVQVMGPVVAMLSGCFTYVISAISLVASRAAPDPGTPGKERASVRKEIMEGLEFVWRSTVLRSLMSSYTINVLFIGAYQAVVILFMARHLQLSAAAIGLVYAIGNTGFLVGAVASRWLSRRAGLGPSTVLGLGLVASGFLVTAAAPPAAAIPVLASGQFISSLGLPIYNVNFVTLRQAMTPNPLLGRVSSVSRVLGRGIVPAGAIIGGALTVVAGPRITVAVAGVGGLIALLPALRGAIVAVRTVDDLERTPS